MAITPDSTIKTERLNIRTTQEEKDLVQQAARLTHVSASQFVLRAAPLRGKPALRHDDHDIEVAPHAPASAGIRPKVAYAHGGRRGGLQGAGPPHSGVAPKCTNGGPEETRHHMAPGVLAQRQMKCLHRLFSRLLSGEAGPLVPTLPARRLRLLQVSLGLLKPISGTVGHTTSVQLWPQSSTTSGAGGATLPSRPRRWPSCTAPPSSVRRRL